MTQKAYRDKKSERYAIWFPFTAPGSNTIFLTRFPLSLQFCLLKVLLSWAGMIEATELRNGLTLPENQKESEHNPERTTWVIALRGSPVSMLPDVPKEPSAVRTCHPGLAEHLRNAFVLRSAAWCRHPLGASRDGTALNSVTTLIIMRVVIILSLLWICFAFFFFLFDGKESRCAWETL